MDKPIRKCRLCFSEQLEYLYNFGNVALGNNLLNNLADTLEVSKYPLQFKYVTIATIFNLLIVWILISYMQLITLI